MARAVFFAWLFIALTPPLAAQPGAAGPGEPVRIDRPEDLGRGTLAFVRDDAMLAAPVLESDYAISVGGMLARTRLRQRFENPTGDWIEGIYVYPLPDGARVDRLVLVVGTRRIDGQIRERTRARSEYERARSQGQRAGLMESERPNLFTTAIANIGPGERVSVEIEYEQPVRYAAGHFSLRLPLVAGPRYVPAEAGGLDAAAQAPGRSAAAARAAGGSLAGGHSVPILPPPAHSGSAAANPVSISVQLDAGMPLGEVRSLYHPITQTLRGAGARDIRLASAQAPADRDFVLEWQTRTETPTTALYTEKAAGGDYALLQFFPPQGLRAPRLPRDVVFVIDTSGSMDGTSIEQARTALLFALQQLGPGDRFNVIRFASDTQLLHSEPVAADAAQLRVAADYVRGLASGGGTEMFHAINAALRQFDAAQSQRVRQVVFMTDGNVGNEQALFDLIRRLLGNTRLYTVGIGSAPNGYFMAAAARYGRGTHTFIGDIGEVAETMSALFEKIAAPVLTDIEIEWPDGAAREVYPQRLPDLFAGEPLLVGIHGALPGQITLRGQMAGAPWSQVLASAEAAQLPGVARHWAGLRIAQLMETRHRAEPGDPIYDAVVATALEHGLVSRYTSLVAVDDTLARAPGQPAVSRSVPVALPAGWQAAGIGMRLPATATSAAWQIAVGLALLSLALAGWLLGRRIA